MDLLYKPDWEQAKDNYRAWWAHEEFGRCGLSVVAPREGFRGTPPRLPDRVEDRWLDFEYLRAVNEYRMGSTYYGGEAFPKWTPGYPGWDMIAAYLGARVDLAEDTGWVHPIIDGGELTDYDCKNLVIRPESKWWAFSRSMHRFAAEQARGKSLPGIQAIGGCGDTLASLRSTNLLLTDVMDCPDRVREFEMYLMGQWIEVFEALYGIIREAAQGCTCWFPLWAPGKFYAAQNDFSYMISPRMFEDIFLPALALQIEYLDYSVYHVDGIAAFAHVDALCAMPKLRALQILPGAGKPSPLFYMDVLKKVQKAGKNLHITIPCAEVEAALDQLSSRGLFIETWCDSEADARSLLSKAEKWSRP